MVKQNKIYNAPRRQLYKKRKEEMTMKKRILSLVLVVCLLISAVAIFTACKKDEDPNNFILMQAVGANVAGQLGSVVAGGIILSLVPQLLAL